MKYTSSPNYFSQFKFTYLLLTMFLCLLNTGKAKAKQRTPRRAALLFPFKRLVSPVLFKKKAHRKRNKTTIL